MTARSLQDFGFQRCPWGASGGKEGGDVSKGAGGLLNREQTRGVRCYTRATRDRRFFVFHFVSYTFRWARGVKKREAQNSDGWEKT